jgi:hypothetical protein
MIKLAEYHARPTSGFQRSGSTLLVVIALMGMLALLGLMFFTFASQEQASAKNYLESAKHITDPELGPDVYFDWALRQCIRGANRNERQSALGAHLSLLAGAYGHDAHPHTGKGIDLINDRTTIQDGNGYGLTAYVEVDLDGDGNTDDINQFPEKYDLDDDGIHDFLEINRSVAANVVNPSGGIPISGVPNELFEHQPERFPEPDVDYTYPDINNAFLANISRIWVTESDADGNGSFDVDENFNGIDVIAGQPETGSYQITVVKPSYWRPELLTRLETSAGPLNDEDANLDGIWDPQTEDANGNNVYDTTDFNGNGDQSQTDDGFARLDPTWYWQPWSRSLILRPHPLHFYIPPVPRQIPGLPPPPPAPAPSEKRFLFESDPNDAAIIASLPGGSPGFPFAGPRDISTGDTIALREGVWRGWLQAPDPTLLISQYEFDADADNDGIREAILLDLGFPAQQRPSDGALYVPMFAMTIYDADGLINLNTAGNLAGDTFDPVPGGGIFGDSQAIGVTEIPEVSISKSHQGLTPFEINPAWALNAIPIDSGAPTVDQTVDVTTNIDYLTYFGRTPLGNGDTVNRWELANMEMWWLNKGRIEFGGAVPDIHEGRLGDASRVWQVYNQGGTPISVNDPFTTVTFGNQTFAMSSLFPFPGDFGTDDNRDANYGGAGNFLSGRTYAFGQPLSVSGRGSFIVGPATGITPDPKSVDMGPTGGGRMKWLRYSNYDVAGTPTWRANLTFQQRSGQLFAVPESSPGANDGYLVDDMTEMIIEPRSTRRPSDEILSVADSAALHLSKTDIDLVGIRSRATELMPGNLNPSDATVEANERRRRFTTSSWDRKQFNFPFIGRLAPGDSPGQDGVDDDRNGTIDDATEIGWPNTDDIRAWEFNLDVDNDDNFEFPPQFLTDSPPKGVAAWSGYAQGLLPQIPQDPFRAQLRRILNVERGNRDELKLQFRLSINGILDVIRSGENGGHPVSSPLEYRPLTPHYRPKPPATNTISSGDLPTLGPGDQLPVLSTNNPEDQEFWARYDRQRLARDIYVLLYTLCGGEDNQDYTTVPGATLYTNRQVAEMAQFAVNLVDQLDQDNVMTIFEYDTDLSDGWDLDDQSWTDEMGDRAVVAGVEQQQLTFSETLWVRQLELANDNPHTAFDETMPPVGASGGTAAYHFADIELRNASPETVELTAGTLTTNAATSVWRIRWTNETGIANIPTVNYQNNIPVGENGIFFLDGAGSIGAGDLFSIGSSTNIDPDSSDLFVNTDGVISDFERVAPRTGPGTSSVTNNTSAASPNTDLDLIHSGHDSRFDLGNGTKSNGDFISRDVEPTTSTPTLVLERRADPELPQLNVNENPWVVVDYAVMTRHDFVAPAIASMGSPSEAETLTALQGLTSTERPEPFEGETEDDNSSGGNVKNSVNATNSNSPGTFDLLQPHFDRDFTSVIELLMLPVREPRQATRSIKRGDQGPTDQYSGGNLVPYTASSKILVPNNPNGPVQWDNHWHRLLSLVEVPTRLHQQLGDDFQTTRVPGKINLNTMRHAHVLAALLDDPLVHGEVNRTNGRLPSLIDPILDWWGDFLRSRDGEHPDFPGTGFSLPGYVASNPFRDLGHMDDIAGGDNPVEDTILRSHPDSPSPTGGGLFDINTNGPDGTGNQLLRRQLLGKLMNNTTTRSNVFFVYIHVQFHEAHEDPTTGAVRVGGRIDLNGDGRSDDGHRGFFIVDRSAAEDAYDPRTGTFDWKQLVKHRVTIN